MITGGAGWSAVAKQLVVTVEKLDGWMCRSESAGIVTEREIVICLY